MESKLVRGFITIAIGTVIWFMPIPEGLKPEAWKLFAIFVATIAGFILQPMPIGAVAFTAITFTALLKVLTPANVLAGFGNGTIWLIVSAFLFAKGFIKTGLGRRIAYMLMRSLGDSTLKLGYTMAITDFFISPATPSNTARGGGIIFPIVKSLCLAFKSEPGESSRRIGSYLMKSAFQCNVVTSGMFMTACSPNPLMVLLAAKTIGVEISWGIWALAAIVPGILSLGLVPFVLYKLYPPEITKTPEAKGIANEELSKMGPMSREEKIVAFVFCGALLLWATSSFTKLNATIVAMLGVSTMMMTRALTWNDAIEEKGAWDTLVWMGSLVALADQLNKLGFIAWFAKGIGAATAGIAWVPTLGILLVAYMYSHYGFASLSAHVTAMYAAFIAVAVTAGAPPLLSALSMAFVSNLMAGLTHYATGPAPIYFGAGYVDQGTWWKLGFILSVINLIIWVGVGSMWWKIIGLW